MTRKILLSSAALALSVVVSAQTVLYSERFDSAPVTLTTVGNNSYTIGNVPTNMAQSNVGGQPSAATAGPFTIAPWKTIGWMCRKFGSDTMALSTSAVTPAGAVDKWLMTPAISGIDPTTVLEWKGLSMSGSAQTLEDYEVWITTSIAGATAAPSDFNGNPNNMLLAITQENYTALTQHGLSLGQYSGQTVYIGFRHISTNKYYLGLNDIKVTAGVTASDVAAQKLYLRHYIKPGSTSVVANVKNKGAQSVSSMEMNYSADGGATVTETISFGTALNYLDALDVTFTQKAPFSTDGIHNIKVWVSAINGNPIASNTSDDSLKASLSVITESPAKKVFLQEFTGAWCQFCPDGAVKMAALIQADPDFIGAAIHNQDGMTTAESDIIDQTYATGYPSATIDHYFFDGTADVAQSRGQWQQYVTARKADIATGMYFLSINHAGVATTTRVTIAK